MNKSRVLRRIAVWGVLAVVGVLWVLGYFRGSGPGGSGVLASLRLEDGSDYMVTQQYNWPEGYIVDFYMRSDGEPWSWCYIDHEAKRWGDVKMSYDGSTDAVSITERGTLRAVLNRKRNTFWINNGSQRREARAPQGHETPAFAFPIK